MMKKDNLVIISSEYDYLKEQKYSFKLYEISKNELGSKIKH